jgi:hypothetical protein
VQLDGGGYPQHAGVVLAGHAAPIESHAGIHVLRFMQRKQLAEYAGTATSSGEPTHARGRGALAPADGVHVSRQSVRFLLKHFWRHIASRAHALNHLPDEGQSHVTPSSPGYKPYTN